MSFYYASGTNLIGPATAENQEQQIQLNQQMLAQLTAMTTIGSEGQLKARLEIAYSDVAQRQIYPVKAGQLITRVVLIVTEPFNDVGARLSIGDSSNPQRLLAEDQSSLTLNSSFDAHPNYAYATDSSVWLYLNAGQASRGRAMIFLYAV